jgi:heterodisulfide reductase subunit A
MGLSTTIVEKAPKLGGHAALYTCKATDACVQCGACWVENQIRQVLAQKAIEVLTTSTVQQVVPGKQYQVTIDTASENVPKSTVGRKADAVIMATGFKPFDPRNKPYGYGRFVNVITNLELEQYLRQHGLPRRPSDDQLPQRMAFIQCVGSRDAKLGHLWCSKVCCASALRMARLIRTRLPEIEIVFFYIDVQSFGRDFQSYYEAAAAEVEMRRVIPGDIYLADGERLRMTTYDVDAHLSQDELFDLVVLSIALTPAVNNYALAEQFGAAPANNGFMHPESSNTGSSPGVFLAGTVSGPMDIAEAVASGSRAALLAARHVLLPDEESQSTY